MKKKVVVLNALFFICCINLSADASLLPDTDTILLEDPQAENIHRYLMANYQQFGGNREKAYEIYKNLTAHRAPKDAYKGYIHLLNDVHAYPEIIRAIQASDNKFKDNAEIQLIYARALQNTGKQKEAAELLVNLNEKYKDNQEIAFEVAQQYLANKEPGNAIIVIDNYLNSSPTKPNNFIFHFLKAQIYMNMNDKHKAMQSVKKCLDMYPQFDKGWILYAMLQEQAGELAQAIKGYSTFLELSGEKNQQLETHLLGLVFRQKMLEQQTTSITYDRPCIENALRMFKDKKYKEALEHIDKCLVIDPKNYDQRLLKIQILSSMQEYDQASKLVLQWVTDEDNKQDWLKALHTLAFDPSFRPHALKTLHSLEKNYNHPLLVALYLADIYTRDKNDEKALQEFTQALTLTADSALKSKIYYQIALIHFNKKDYKEMEAALEAGQRLQENFPPLMNLLAYHYASTNRLDQAQELVNVLLKKDKKNPHFWDTQALVYYHKGNYAKSVKILQKVVKAVPSDFTAMRHLAKAEFKRGNIDKARSYAQQALKLASNTQEQEQCNKYLTCWNKKK